MILLNAPKGLGDAIYQRAIVLRLLEMGEKVRVFTHWPDVFMGLPIAVSPVEELDSAEGELRQARYQLRDHTIGDQFSMACARAGVAGIPLKIDWAVCNKALVKDVLRQARGKPIMLYQSAKLANNEEQRLLRPNRDVVNAYLNERGDYFLVRLGSSRYVIDDRAAPRDLDLFDQTTVGDAFDLGTIADRFFGETCYLLIMAEAMDKPFTCMFTRRGLRSDYERVRNINPLRAVFKKHLLTAVYDESEESDPLPQIPSTIYIAA